MQPRANKRVPLKRRAVVYAIGIAAFAAAIATIPSVWCGRNAAKWMSGELETQLRLARGVERLVLGNELSRERFRTGSHQFNGEWLFGTYLMAGLGFGQMALEHPELRERHAILMSQCIERLLSPEVRVFDAETWKEDPLQGLDGNNAHGAYLGYLNLLLGMHRLASGEVKYASLNDRITAKLIRHLRASPILMIESYPGEVYPADNCFAIGSIGLHQRVTGRDHTDVLEPWIKRLRKHYVDPKTGLLIQSVSKHTGSVLDAPRGSGTAFGLFAVHYADPELARDLYRGIKRSLAGTCLGFGAVREYPNGINGQGDIDSGPIMLGYGLSATGFTIAGARMMGDDRYFEHLFAMAHLFGAPINRGDRREYLSGGALGNAILFAMFTAPKLYQTEQGEEK
ncbi:MAG: hypothetical protein PVH02_14065 [Desulfobacteraceae bacterium]